MALVWLAVVLKPIFAQWWWKLSIGSRSTPSPSQIASIERVVSTLQSYLTSVKDSRGASSDMTSDIVVRDASRELSDFPVD